jgi:hypothetical protein
MGYWKQNTSVCDFCGGGFETNDTVEDFGLNSPSIVVFTDD